MTFAPRLLALKNPFRILTPSTGSGASTGRSGTGIRFLCPAPAAILVAVLGHLPTSSCAFELLANLFGSFELRARCFKNVLWGGLCGEEDILFLKLARSKNNDRVSSACRSQGEEARKMAQESVYLVEKLQNREP